MVYVALLRGINVGGKAMVPMAKLRAAFEALHCQNVSTYINSGNVIFCDNRSIAELTPIIEAALLTAFGMPLRIVIRDIAALRAVCEGVPSAWMNDAEQRTDVLFLWDAIDSPTIVTQITIHPDFERVCYIAGSLVWNIGREYVAKGVGVKLIKSDMYRFMTVRNITTVRKLYVLMSNVEGVGDAGLPTTGQAVARGTELDL